MQQTLLCLALVAVARLAMAPASLAQKPVIAPPTAAELKKDIAVLAHYYYQHKTNNLVDPEALADRTARKLAKYLLTHDLSAVAAQKLGLMLNVDSKDAAHLRVYTFYFHSGGTRGTQDIPVAQWRNAAGQRLSYPLRMENAFEGIYKLIAPSRTLYLLLGREQSDGRCTISSAFVVELKGNYLLVDNAIFDKSSLLSFCDVGMSFNPAKQKLRFDITHFDFDYYKPEDDEYKLLTRWGFRNPATTKMLSLRFDSYHFVKSQ